MRKLINEDIEGIGKSLGVTERARTVPKVRNTGKDKTVLALDVGGVIDVLDAGNKLVYLTEKGEVVEGVTINGVVHKPPPKEGVPYLLPDKDKVLEYIKKDVSDRSDGELYRCLRDYHAQISELPHDLYYDLLVLWDIHTYLLGKLHFSPILYFYAVKERGKSRTGKGCIYVSRRGVFTETIREADIIRWGNDHKAVLGFDVKDYPKKIQRANCDDLLLARFEKGSIASRTLWPEKGAFKDTKTFKIFGPTIVMTNRPVDDILESRCISVDMKPSFTNFKNPVLPEDSLDLKARLTAFRFKHYDTKLSDIEKPAVGRLGEILGPLNNIVHTLFPDRVENFNKLTKIIIEQKKEEATDTFEAQVVEAVIAAEPQVMDGFISVDTITSLFNEGKNEKFQIRNSTIGRILKGLGFTSRRTTGGKRGIFYDPEMVKKVSYQYGLIDIDVSETVSLPSLLTDSEAKQQNPFDISQTTSETTIKDKLPPVPDRF